MKITSYSKGNKNNFGSVIELETDNALSYLRLLDSTLADIKNMLEESGDNLSMISNNADIDKNRKNILSTKSMLLSIKRSLLAESYN